MRLASSVKKRNCALVFLLSLFVHLLPLLRTFRMNLVSDNIGPLLLAARIAGLHWPSASGMAYYGQGYYVLFAPLFRITSDPYVFYIVVLFCNILLISMTGVLIYVIAVQYFGLREGMSTVFVAAICTTLLGRLNTDFTNEVPVFFVVWLVTILLLCAYCATEKKKRTFWTLLLCVALSWGLTVHTRLLVLVLAVGVSVIIYKALFRVWAVNPLVFFPGMALGYWGNNLFKAFFAREFLGGRSADSIRNASLNVGALMTQLPLNRTSIRVFLDTMVGNFFKLVVETNGVAMATLVLAVYVVMRVLKHMFVKQRDCDNVTGMPGSHFLVLIVFGACIFATIAGLFSFYGVGIYRAYANKTQARGMIGLAYYRYYIPFFGPLLLVTASFGKRNAKCLRNICATAIGTFAILALYVSRYILPYMGKGVYAQQFIKSGFGKIGIVGTIIFIAIFLAWYMVLCIKKRMSLFFVCFFIVIVVIRLQMVTWPFFDIVGERRSVETYNALHYMEKSAILPKLLYSSSGGFMRIQFMLSRHPIVPAIPDVHENDDYVFISATPTDEGCEVLTDMGFRCYVLSDTECLWIRGESLQAKLKEYAYLVSMENGIVPPEISLLLDTFNTDALYVNGNRRTSFVYAVLYPDKTVPNLTSARLAEAGENALIIYDTPGALRYTDHIAFGSRFLFSQNPAILAYCVAKEGVAISAEREIPLEAMFVDGRHVAGNEALIQPQSILYGPYILLAAGEYEITLRGKGLHLNNARLTGNDGQIRFDSHVKTQQEDLLVLTCRLASLENHFEVVIENTSDADVVVTDIHIEKVVSP